MKEIGIIPPDVIRIPSSGIRRIEPPEWEFLFLESIRAEGSPPFWSPASRRTRKRPETSQAGCNISHPGGETLSRLNQQDLSLEITGSVTMKTQIRLLGIALLLLAFAGLCTGADQVPSMPHAFYGIVYVGADPAPAGASVEARGTGVEVPSAGNPLLTGSGGTYGAAGALDSKLKVQGTVGEGTPIEFYVNGARAEVSDVDAGSGWTDTFPFNSSAITELNLRVASLPGTTVATPTVTAASQGGGGGGGGGSGAGSYTAQTASPTGVPSTPTPAGAPTSTAAPEVTAGASEASPEEAAPTPTQTATTQQTTAAPPMNPLALSALAGIFVVIAIAAVGRQGGLRRKLPEE